MYQFDLQLSSNDPKRLREAMREIRELEVESGIDILEVYVTEKKIP